MRRCVGRSRADGVVRPGNDKGIDRRWALGARALRDEVAGLVGLVAAAKKQRLPHDAVYVTRLDGYLAAVTRMVGRPTHLRRGWGWRSGSAPPAAAGIPPLPAPAN